MKDLARAGLVPQHLDGDASCFSLPLPEPPRVCKIQASRPFFLVLENVSAYLGVQATCDVCGTDLGLWVWEQDLGFRHWGLKVAQEALVLGWV